MCFEVIGWFGEMGVLVENLFLKNWEENFGFFFSVGFVTFFYILGIFG